MNWGKPQFLSRHGWLVSPSIEYLKKRLLIFVTVSPSSSWFLRMRILSIKSAITSLTPPEKMATSLGFTIFCLSTRLIFNHCSPSLKEKKTPMEYNYHSWQEISKNFSLEGKQKTFSYLNRILMWQLFLEQMLHFTAYYRIHSLCNSLLHIMIDILSEWLTPWATPLDRKGIAPKSPCIDGTQTCWNNHDSWEKIMQPILL